MSAARRTIYLDHSATTPVDPRVLEAMLPYFTEAFGNPSSLYGLGRRANQALTRARQRVAAILNCQPREVVFTGGGSESDNLALRGVALARAHEGRHLVTTAIEHHAIGHTMQQLRETHGFEVTEVAPDERGFVSAEAVEAVLRPDTVLVSVMYANNEVGTIQPLAQIGALTRARGITFHTDAVQAGAFLPLDVEALGVDLLSLSAHKFYGPKGTGLLYIRRGTPYGSTLTGGGQEEGRRAGTHNLPGIVGLATALELAQQDREATNERLRAMRDHLIGAILERVEDAALTGHPAERLPGHASFTIGGVEADALLMGLDLEGVAASSGSACSSGAAEPSHVLMAMGVPHARAMGALRLTLGQTTTPDDVTHAVDAVAGVVARLRAFQPG